MATSPFALTPTLIPPSYRWPLRRHAESCGQKRQYLTRAEAQAILATWQGWRDPRVQVYECTACGLFHLGRYAGVANS